MKPKLTVISNPSLYVPITDEEKSEMERHFIRLIGDFLKAKLSGIGLKLVDVVGHSTVGWGVGFDDGDGRQHLLHVEPQELYVAQNRSGRLDNFVESSCKYIYDQVVERVERTRNPLPPTPGDILRAPGAPCAIQVGEGIRDALGDEWNELVEASREGLPQQ